jgi:hypothetical protein
VPRVSPPAGENRSRPFAGRSLIRSLSSSSVGSATKQITRKFGYPTRKAAQDAAEHVGKLLNLATSEADSRRIGDMLRAVRQGSPLPTVGDVQRRLGLGLDPAHEGLTLGAREPSSG